MIKTRYAALAAFTEEIARRKREEDAARAASAEQRAKKMGKKDKAPLTYKQIAAAYQASLNNFKAALKNAQAKGMSASQAEALRKQVAQEGKIGGALGVAQGYIAPKAAKKGNAAPARSPAKPPAMPAGLSPEAQQAFLHGGSGAQAWIKANTAQLQEQHRLDVARRQSKAQSEHEQAIQAQGAPQGVAPKTQAAVLHSGSAAVWVDANKEKLQKDFASRQDGGSGWDRVVVKLQNVWTTTLETVTEVWNGTREIGSSLWDSAKSLTLGFLVDTNQTFVETFDKIGGILSGAGNTVAGSINIVRGAVGQVIPEVAWQPLTEAERTQLLTELRDYGQAGQATADYIEQENVSFGYFPQAESGAGWTTFGNITLVPGDNLSDPLTLSLIVHETQHLQQGFLTRLSVEGELEAWQIGYQAYYEETGMYFGEAGAPFNDNDPAEANKDRWARLAQLSLDSRQDLEEAQKLMLEIRNKYRADQLPLYPAFQEMQYYFERGEIKEGLNVIPKLIFGP